MASDRVSGTGRVRVPLAEVLVTGELARRPSRAPGYQTENSVLAALAVAVAETPETFPKAVADAALKLSGAHSAGITVLDSSGPSPVYRWHAVSGQLSSLTGSAESSNSSPCALALERGATLLFAGPERHFDYGMRIDPSIVEMLITPFFVEDKLAGAVWVVTHTPDRKFDAEDERLVAGLARFAAAARHMTAALRAAEAARAELEQRVEERTAALRAGELRYRRLIDGNIIGVVSMTADGQVLDANDAFLGMVGHAREDVQAGRLNWQAITPSESIAAEREFARSHPPRNGRVAPHEREFLHKSGVRVPALVGGAFLEGNSGESVCFVLDIAERRRQELDEQFLGTLDMTLHHLVDVDDVGNTVAQALGAHIDARCVLSQTREDMGMRGLHSIWSSDGKTGGGYLVTDFISSDFQESLRRGGIGVINDVRIDPRTAAQAQNFSKTGVGALLTIPWLHEGRWRGNLSLVSPSPRVWTDREAALARQVAARVWPLIEHARALRALRESEARLRLFIDQAPAAIAMLDRDMRYLAASRRWLADYGLAGQDVIGRSYYEVFPDLPEGWREIHRRALAGEVLKAEEDWFLRADGVLGWLKWEVRPWHASGGEIGGIVIFTEDISQRKQAEAALHTLNETLEQRIAERASESEARAAQLRKLATEVTEVEQRERRRLAAILHDHLQQLLVSARMHMQSVTSRITDQDLKQVLDKTDLLLDECITESQSLSHHLSPPILDKMGLLPALAWLAEEQEDKHGLAVVLSYDEGIEPVDPVVAAILFHAVRELLFNIVKHAKVKQAEVHVTSADQRISIEVRDAGVGFDPSIAGDKAGALGLHSIRERLRLFGGELEMIATPGKGARAILHAPLGEVGAAVQPQAMRLRVSSVMARTGDPALRSSETGAGPARKREPIKRKIESTRVARRPAADRSSVHREAESASAERRVRILLVDDHPLTRSFLTEMLSPYNGIEVVGEASDGAEAVTAAMRLKPDVVLMDVSMPQLNGIEATRRIVAQLQNVRVIGISLHETEFMAEAMREAGAIDYFRKNEPVAVLLEKILRHMNV